jgi:hypothetical protein
MVNKKTTKSKAKNVTDEQMDVDPAPDQTSKATKGSKGQEKEIDRREKEVRISLLFITFFMYLMAVKTGDDVDMEADGDADAEAGTQNVEEEVTTEHNVFDVQDGQAQAARFSINVIDIFNPPKEIVFGRWNPRALKETEANKLKQQFLLDEIRPFRFENMFNIVVDKRFIDPSTISLKIDGGNQNAPMLKLSVEGIASLSHLDFAGGRHRLRAMQMVKTERMDKLKKLQDQVRKLKDRNANKGEERDGEKISRLEATIKEESLYLSKFGKWGVMLYDSGE